MKILKCITNYFDNRRLILLIICSCFSLITLFPFQYSLGFLNLIDVNFKLIVYIIIAIYSLIEIVLIYKIIKRK